MFLFPHILDLITKVSTELPKDVIDELNTFQKNETSKGGKIALSVISENINLAKEIKAPLCQDTGFPTFWVQYSGNLNQEFITDQIHKAVRMATKKGLLRPNAVDSITGENSGDNIGEGFPKIIFEYDKTREKDEIIIKLLLKGGGCENTSDQFALPIKTDFGRANRDLEGVKKAVLQIVKNAEGKGCAPGILGVHIGGDRGVGYEKAKKNLFRSVRSDNQYDISDTLEKLEKEIVNEANQLDIGPMGFGGKTTILDCFISSSHRLPASFFVTVSYSCWALRRGSINIDMKTNTTEFLGISKFDRDNGIQETDFSSAKKIELPLQNTDVDNLEKGDMVLLSGKIYTGRDQLHHAVVEEDLELPVDLNGSAIYHCGPIMKQNSKGDWECISAGPTTSIREESYQAEFIEKTGIKAVIGKGNMGEKTQNALTKYKAIYFHAIGGAAAVYAKCIKKVPQVFFLEEYGMPEAMWEMEVEDFPVMVTMK